MPRKEQTVITKKEDVLRGVDGKKIENAYDVEENEKLKSAIDKAGFSVTEDMHTQEMEALKLKVEMLLTHKLPSYDGLDKEVSTILQNMPSEEVKRLRGNIQTSLSAMSSRMDDNLKDLSLSLQNVEKRLEDYRGKYKGRAQLQHQETILLRKIVDEAIPAYLEHFASKN